MDDKQNDNKIGSGFENSAAQPINKAGNTSKPKIYILVFSVFLILSIGFVGGMLGARTYWMNGGGESNNTNNAKRVVSEESELISSIAKNVGPSVVSINVTGGSSRDSFSGQSIAQQSAGTGFIISKDGYIITNRHVVPAGSTKVSIIMSDGAVFDDVRVVGRTNETDPLDVAFLKITDTKGKKLIPAKIGDSDNMQVGDMVVAIGNALGQFQNTVTSGIVSGYGRSVDASDGQSGVESLQNLFQTDAAINQGNSGGPLVNSDGEVIGINTAIAGDAQNIGFAIPINDAKGLIKGVIEKGRLLRPYVGVRYIQLTAENAKELKQSTSEGAYIPEGSDSQPSILPNSPASKAGLAPGDIITKINDKKVTQTTPLNSVVSRFAVGETVTVTYLRDGKEKTVQLKLELIPQD
jgi:serine protease Do